MGIRASSLTRNDGIQGELRVCQATAVSLTTPRPLVTITSLWLEVTDTSRTERDETRDPHVPVDAVGVLSGRRHSRGTAANRPGRTIPIHDLPRARFGAVDESCWVYVNGELAASFQYDPVKNPDSWEQPLELPLGPAFRAGAPNTIAIRVHDSEGAGGIWRGAFLVFREPR